MRKSWNTFLASAPPFGLVAVGFIWAGVVDQARGWALAKMVATPYMVPMVFVLAGIAWFAYSHLRPPVMEIVCEPSHHPFRQEWDDDGGHQILFRIGIRNRSRHRAVNKAVVQITLINPFDMLCIPARLLLMNEDPSAREFFLPASGTQYVDLIQQSQPSGDAFLWHIVKNQPIKLKAAGNFKVDVTAYGDNADSASQRFDVVKEGTVFALKPIDS